MPEFPKTRHGMGWVLQDRHQQAGDVLVALRAPRVLLLSPPGLPRVL